MLDAIVIGAGPCGLAAAISLKKAGLQAKIVEKGYLVNSVYHYPLSMTFFSTPEKIEIGGIPFITVGDKPTRHEALKYYRTIANYFDLDIHTREEVQEIKKCVGGFQVVVVNRSGKQVYGTRNVVLATGYYDQPNRLGIPGEDQDHVYHYFREAHPFAGANCIVIGGKNSAVDTALELQLAGAKVTLIHRHAGIDSSVKAWVKPMIENAIQYGRIDARFEAVVEEITQDSIHIRQNGKEEVLPADFVFAMTGYRPNLRFVKQLGGEIDSHHQCPVYDEETMETSVSGLYLAGVVASGNDSGKIFIENGRFHGDKIAASIKQKQEVSQTVS